LVEQTPRGGYLKIKKHVLKKERWMMRKLGCLKKLIFYKITVRLLLTKSQQKKL